MKTRSAVLCLCWLVWSLFTFQLRAQSHKAKAKKDTTKKATPTSLFKATDLSSLTLIADYSAILKDRDDKPISHPATLAFADVHHSPFQVPIKVIVRGNFRRSVQHCKFPPLLLDFAKSKTKQTLFQRRDKLKLVTHCQQEEYVVREYMVYKIYNLLSDYSFRARLMKVTYQDANGKRSIETKHAFLLEDEESLAHRQKATLYEQKQLTMSLLDSVQMATVAVFEYMIGNTDWSVPYLHNIRLLAKKKRSAPIPVPYDFDHAGIVEAGYALPAQQLEIQSVRERLYRGYRYSDEVFARVFKKFRKHKAKIYALYQNQPGLSPTYIKRTLKYLDEFYRIIDKPSLAKASIFDKGEKNASGGVVIKGLK